MLRKAKTGLGYNTIFFGNVLGKRLRITHTTSRIILLRMVSVPNSSNVFSQEP